MKKLVMIGALCVLGFGCTSAKIVNPNGDTVYIKDFHPLRRHELGGLSVTSPGQTTLKVEDLQGDTSQKAKDGMQLLMEFALQARTPQVIQVPVPGPVQVVTAAPPVVVVSPPDTIKPVTNNTPPPANELDALNITDATLLGTHANVDPAQAVVTRRLNGAELRDGKLWLDYAESMGWPNADGEPGTCGRNYLYWVGGDGRPRGGHFEWTTDGRRDRGLGNIYGGYLSGEMPPAGAACWTCTVRNNGEERTQVVSCGTWPG